MQATVEHYPNDKTYISMTGMVKKGAPVHCSYQLNQIQLVNKKKEGGHLKTLFGHTVYYGAIYLITVLFFLLDQYYSTSTIT